MIGTRGHVQDRAGPVRGKVFLGTSFVWGELGGSALDRCRGLFFGLVSWHEVGSLSPGLAPHLALRRNDGFVEVHQRIGECISLQ